MNIKILSLCFVLICIFNVTRSEEDVAEAQLEKKEDESAEISHQIDSLNLLIFVSLLIATVLTIWLFKRVRLRFVHETGLSIIYGLIMGAIIRYSYRPIPSSRNGEVQIIPVNISSFNSSTYLPPDYLKLNVVSNSDHRQRYYKYSLTSQVDKDDSIKPELEEKATFDPEVFFNVLLPPIIFNAGYSMKRKHFFKNFGAISTFAFLGTLISSFVVSFIMYGFLTVTGSHWSYNDCLKFGAIISATDPVSVLTIFHDLNVDVDLYALVFGESILNDAVAIVLVSTVDTYKSEKTGFDGMAVIKSVGNFFMVFFGAFTLGCTMGCVTALMTKFTHVRDHPLLETSLFVLMSYLTFLAAEAAQMTGIVAVLFCGICQAHYTYSNMSPESKARTKQIFELLNFLAENFVFVYLGVSTFTFSKHIWNFPFILMSFMAIIAARACNIYPLSLFINLARKFKIPFSFQHFMMFSGLRGAMAFALAIRDTSSPNECTIFTATLVIVMTTIVLSGGFTAQLLVWLKIRVGVLEDREVQAIDSLNSQGRHLHQSSSRRSLLGLWYKLDYRFIKPLLTHSRPPLTDTLPRCCLALARVLTTEQQKQQVSIAGNERADDDSDFEFALVGEQELNYEDTLLHSSSVFNLSDQGSNPGPTADQGRTNAEGARPQLSLQVKLPGRTGDAV